MEKAIAGPLSGKKPQKAPLEPNLLEKVEE